IRAPRTLHSTVNSPTFGPMMGESATTFAVGDDVSAGAISGFRIGGGSGCGFGAAPAAPAAPPPQTAPTAEIAPIAPIVGLRSASVAPSVVTSTANDRK